MRSKSFLVKQLLKNGLRKYGFELLRVRPDWTNYVGCGRSFEFADVIAGAVAMPDQGAVVVLGARSLVFHDGTLGPLFSAPSAKRLLIFEPRLAQSRLVTEALRKLSMQNAVVIDEAVWRYEGELGLYVLNPIKGASYPEWAGSIASVRRDLIERHVRGEDVAEIKVRCSTPDCWFGRFGVSKISYLQIDGGGSDFEILRSINLALHSPSVIRLAFSGLDDADKARCASYLYPDYDLFHDGMELLAVRFKDLL